MITQYLFFYFLIRSLAHNLLHQVPSPPLIHPILMTNSPSPQPTQVHYRHSLRYTTHNPTQVHCRRSLRCTTHNPTQMHSALHHTQPNTDALQAQPALHHTQQLNSTLDFSSVRSFIQPNLSGFAFSSLGIHPQVALTFRNNRTLQQLLSRYLPKTRTISLIHCQPIKQQINARKRFRHQFKCHQIVKSEQHLHITHLKSLG